MRTYLDELTPADRVRSRRPDTGNDPTWTADKCYGYRCTQSALDFLEKHKDEDFLLVISYDEPHGPALCPIEYSRMYEDFTFPTNVNVNDALTDKPEEQRVWAMARLKQTQPPINAPHFFGAHTFIDHEIGRVLDTVDVTAYFLNRTGSLTRGRRCMTRLREFPSLSVGLVTRRLISDPRACSRTST
jgi:uncharacterized sulfatase